MASFNNKVYHAMSSHGNRRSPIMQWSALSASCALSNDAVCSYDAAVSGPSVSAARSSHCCESQVSDGIIMNLSSPTSLRLKANRHHKLLASSVGVSLHIADF